MKTTEPVVSAGAGCYSGVGVVVEEVADSGILEDPGRFSLVLVQIAAVRVEVSGNDSVLQNGPERTSC